MNAAVLDTCVTFKWFHHLDEEDVDVALLLRDAWLGGALEITVPDLLVYELANTFRYKEPLKPIEADAAMSGFWSLGIQIHPVDETLARSAIQLAHKFDISAYDAAFLALAAELSVPLFTADRTLHKKAGKGHPVILLAEMTGL